MEIDLSKNLTLSLISIHEFLSNTSTNQNDDSLKNAIKIQLLISEVLTPIIQEWFKNYVTRENITNIWFDIKNNNHRSLNSANIILKTYMSQNDNQCPNDFSLFDITSCVAIARLVLKIEPKHGWLEKYSEIKLNDFKEGDALNYARLIRNLIAHKAEFKVEKKEFDLFVEQLDKIFYKLNINDELKKLKGEILKNEIEQSKQIEFIQKWIKDKNSNQKEIRFKSEIVQHIKPTENLTINTQHIQLTSLYIQQSFDEQNLNYLTFKIDYFLNSFDKIESFLKSKYFKDYKTILIECFENKERNQQLKEFISKIPENSIFNENPNQIEMRPSMIIIGIDNFNNKSFKPFQPIRVNLNNFVDESKEIILQKLIKFQGKEISLKNIIDIQDLDILQKSEIKNSNITKIFNLFDSELLEKLITNQQISFFNQNQLEFETIQNYYIKRTFQRFIYLKNEILEDQEFLKNNQIILSENELNLNNHSNSKNVHLLRRDSSNKLEWIKSKGKVSDLNKFLRYEFDNYFNENEFLDQPDKLIIICEEPGMGKSTILTSLANLIQTNKEKQVWSIKIILNKIKSELVDLRTMIDKKKFDPFDFIIELLTPKPTQIETRILKNLANLNKLVLMFDGFDEVLDYNVELLKLIDNLKSLNLNKIILTSREHAKSDLEDKFQTLAYKMKKFEQFEQIEFLTNYWLNLNQNLSEYDLKVKARRIIETFNKSSSNKKNDLIGIPLQTRMIAEIYQDELENEDYEFENLADFYDKFILAKYNIKLKKHGHDYDRANEEENFYNYHYKYSFELIFDNKIIKESKEVNLIREKIKNYGIIVDFDEKLIPKFLHQSYAEYFIAQSIIENKVENEYKNLIEFIFEEEKYFLIWKFLNDFLCNQKNTKDYENSVKNIKLALTKKIFDSDFVSDISKRLKLHFPILFNLKEIVELLIDEGVDLNERYENNRNALHFASLVGQKEVVELLIEKFTEKGIKLNEKDKWGKNALHIAFSNQFKDKTDIVELIINKFIENKIDLNEKDNDGWNALHLASEKGHKEIVELLINKFNENKIPLNEKTNNDQNALILAFSNQFRDNKEIVELLINKFIEKGIKLDEKDKWGFNALHSASSKGQKETVELLINKFIENKINLNQKDEYDGRNALHFACRWKENKQTVELLIDKFIENNIDLNEKDREGSNPLHLATQYGQKEIVELLINKFIEKGIDLNEKDNGGRNALHLASIHGHKQIVELLIEKFIDNRINLNQKDKYYGKNALHLASENGYKEIVELLINKFIVNKIDLNEKDKDGRNALHLACSSWKPNKELVELLINKFIENKTELNQKDRMGWDALNLASKNGQKEIVELLLKFQQQLK